tara:strand:- start:35 stop:418 length:384 start_codon:yes stop_codon:yes gene_type:complete
MTNETDRLAIELQAVKTQINRLETKRDALKAQILAIAPEQWVNNQRHLVSDTIDGELYNMKLEWRHIKESKPRAAHFQKWIVPVIDGQKFEGKECYVDQDQVLHMVEHTHGDEDMMDLIIPPLPVFE